MAGEQLAAGNSSWSLGIKSIKAPKRARCTAWSEGALLAVHGWHGVTVPRGALQVSVTWKSGCETFLLSIPTLSSTGLSSAWSI